jgi:hypothetical protein
MKRLALLCVSTLWLASNADAQSTSASRMALVQDFIRGLVVSHEIKEGANAPAADRLSALSSGMSRKAESLGISVSALKSIHLGAPDDAQVQALIRLCEQDKSLYEDAAGILAAGGKSPNVANMDRDTILILQIDRAILNMTPAVFSFLVNKESAAQGHMGRLFIPQAQRQQLIDQLDMAFGSNPDASDRTGVSGAAIFLKSSLQKDFLASDE